MVRTRRSAVLVCGLALVVAGLTGVDSGHELALGLGATALGVLLIGRSGIDRPLRRAAAVVLLVLGARVAVVAAPSPVDWPALGVAALILLTAVVLLQSRGRPAGTPPPHLS